MSGINNAIATALSGLDLFEAGISTVANNIANAATPGYAAESVNASTAASAPGQPGSGVQPAQIIRAASGFAAAQLRAANAANAAASAQSTALTSLSNALTNNGDVQTALNQFFENISSLAANPTSTAQRQTVLGSAQTVTTAFQSAAGAITATNAAATTTLTSGLTSANTLLGQLATINKGLAQTPANPSLLDQQQAALNSLSQLLPVSTLPLGGNGAVIVTTGGAVLLDQSGAQSLTASTTAAGMPTITAGSNAVPVPLGERDGSLGAALGNIQAGNAALQSLNNLAANFAGQVNNAQSQGLTASGAQGQALFTVPPQNAAAGISLATSQASDIAAADPYVATAGMWQSDGSILNNNAGTITPGSDTVTSAPAANAAVIPASAYGQNLQLNFTSATAYTVSLAGSTTPVIASGALNGNGGNIAIAYPGAAGQYWQLPFSGTPASGDTLTLTPGGSSSGSNAQRMAALWTTPGTTASGSLEQAFIGFATGLGANASTAQTLATATAAQVSTATSNLQTLAGVNTDQQAVQLSNYQQAYQAAAQVISAARTMFTSLLQAV